MVHHWEPAGRRETETTRSVIVSASRSSAAIGVLFTALFWSGNAIVARWVVDEIPPFTLNFWRWAVALAVILPFGIQYVVAEWREVRRCLWPLTVLGLLSVSLFNFLLYLAAYTTTATNLVLVNSSLPLLTLALSWIFLRHRPRRSEFYGIGVAGLGLILILARWNGAGPWVPRFNTGDVLMLMAVISWALYSVLLKRWPMRLHALTIFTVMIAIGLVALLPFYWIEYRTVGGIDFSAGQVAVFFYVGVFASAAAHVFWYHGVKALGPFTTSMFTYLIPVLTAVLAHVVLGEALTIYHLIGGMLVFAGFMVSTVTLRT